jgi:hypothetical protein
MNAAYKKNIISKTTSPAWGVKIYEQILVNFDMWCCLILLILSMLFTLLSIGQGVWHLRWAMGWKWPFPILNGLADLPNFSTRLSIATPNRRSLETRAHVLTMSLNHSVDKHVALAAKLKVPYKPYEKNCTVSGTFDLVNFGLILHWSMNHKFVPMKVGSPHHQQCTICDKQLALCFIISHTSRGTLV